MMLDFDEPLDYEPESLEDNQYTECLNKEEKLKNKIKDVPHRDRRSRYNAKANTDCDKNLPVACTNQINKNVLNKSSDIDFSLPESNKVNVASNQNTSSFDLPNFNSTMEDNDGDDDDDGTAKLVYDHSCNENNNNNHGENLPKAPDISRTHSKNNFVIIFNSQQSKSANPRIVLSNATSNVEPFKGVSALKKKDVYDNNSNNSMLYKNEYQSEDDAVSNIPSPDNDENSCKDNRFSYRSTFRQIEVSSPSDSSQAEYNFPNISTDKQNSPYEPRKLSLNIPLTNQLNSQKKPWINGLKIEEDEDYFLCTSHDKILQNSNGFHGSFHEQFREPKVEVFDELEFHEEQIKWEEPSTSLKYFDVVKNPENKSFIIVSKVGTSAASQNSSCQSFGNAGTVQTSSLPISPVKNESHQSEFASGSDMTFDSVSLMSDTEFRSLTISNILSSINDADDNLYNRRVNKTECNTTTKTTQKELFMKGSGYDSKGIESKIELKRSALKLKRIIATNKNDPPCDGCEPVQKLKLSTLLKSPQYSKTSPNSSLSPLKCIQSTNGGSQCLISPYFSKSREKQIQTPEKKIRTPEKRMQTPEKRMQTPEKKIQTAEKRMQTPEKRMQTPEKKIRTPEKRMQTPEKRMQTPEKQIQTPGKQIQISENKEKQTKELLSPLSKISPSLISIPCSATECSSISKFCESFNKYCISKSFSGKSPQIQSPTSIVPIPHKKRKIRSSKQIASVVNAPRTRSYYKFGNTSVDLSSKLVVRLERIPLPISRSTNGGSSTESESIVSSPTPTKELNKSTIESVQNNIEAEVSPPTCPRLQASSFTVEEPSKLANSDSLWNSENSSTNVESSDTLDAIWHKNHCENSRSSKVCTRNSDSLLYPGLIFDSFENVPQLSPNRNEKEIPDLSMGNQLTEHLIRGKKDECRISDKDTIQDENHSKKNLLIDETTSFPLCSGLSNEENAIQLSTHFDNGLENTKQQSDHKNCKDTSFLINEITQFPTSFSSTHMENIDTVDRKKVNDDHEEEIEDGEIESSDDGHNESKSGISLSVSSEQKQQIASTLTPSESNYTFPIQASTMQIQDLNDLGISGMPVTYHNQICSQIEECAQEGPEIPSENQGVRMDRVSEWLNRSESPLLSCFDKIEDNHLFHNSKVPDVFKDLCLSIILNGCCYNSPGCNRNHNYSEKLNRLSELPEKALLNAYNFSKTINNFYEKVYIYFAQAFAEKDLKHYLINMIHTIFEENFHKINKTEGLNQVLIHLLSTGIKSLQDAIEYVVLNIGLKKHQLLGASILEILYSKSNVLIYWPLMKKLALAGEKLPANVATSFLTKLKQNTNDYQQLNDIYRCIIEYKFIDLSKVAPEILDEITYTSAGRTESFQNEIDPDHNVYVQNIPINKANNQVTTNSNGLIVIQVENASRKLTEHNQVVMGAPIQSSIPTETANNRRLDDTASSVSSIARGSEQGTNSTSLNFDTNYQDSCTSYEPSNSSTPRSLNVFGNHEKEIDRTAWAKPTAVTKQSKQTNTVRFSDRISCIVNANSFPQYDPSCSGYGDKNDTNYIEYDPASTYSYDRSEIDYLPTRINGALSNKVQNPIHTLEQPKFGTLYFNSDYKFMISLHNLYLENIEAIDIDTDDVRILDDCIKIADAKEFLKLVDKYKGPLTVQNFISMSLAHLNHQLDKKKSAPFLDLVSNIEKEDLNYYENIRTRVILEVIAMNFLFELDRRHLFQDCKEVLFKFLDWDSLITSRLFVQQNLTMSGRYLFIAKLLIFSQPELTYEILICPTFRFFDPDHNWYLSDSKTFRRDFELRNFVLHTFLKHSFRLNIQVVIELYKGALSGKLWGFDVTNYINPMVSDLINRNDILCLKQICSIYNMFIKHLDKHTIRAYLILCCTFLSKSDAIKLMVKSMEYKAYPQLMKNELTKHRIEITTNMTDVELELIIKYYFDCLIKIRNLPSGTKGLIFEILLDATESRFPNIIKVKSARKINTIIRRLLRQICSLESKSITCHRIEVEKDELISYLERNMA